MTLKEKLENVKQEFRKRIINGEFEVLSAYTQDMIGYLGTIEISIDDVSFSIGLCDVKFITMNWIEYNKQKPKIGQLVLVYRDVESKLIYSTVWSDEDERFADWNEITHWMPLEYPAT